MNGIRYAPWSEEEVELLKEWQTCGFVHPFTYGMDDGSVVDLIPTKDGWIAQEGGPIVQNWVHEFMFGDSWKNRVEKFKQYNKDKLKDEKIV